MLAKPVVSASPAPTRWAVSLVAPALLAFLFPAIVRLLFTGEPDRTAPQQDTPIVVARIEAVHSYGKGAVEHLILINGGAIVGALTFLGHIFSSDDRQRIKRAQLLTKGLLPSLACYSAGLFSSVLSGLLWFYTLMAYYKDRPERGGTWLQEYCLGAGLMYFVAGTVVAALAFHGISRDSEGETASRPVAPGA